jgi:N-acetylneuraminic acid mutarotase
MKAEITMNFKSLSLGIHCRCLVLLVLLHFHSASMFGQESLHWRELPALPDQEGFAGPFAGTDDKVLMIAGGANFPKKMPWEGGTKVWYDRVYLLEALEGNWREVGKLPRPLGYGVSISTVDGVVCIGGSDANRHYQDCFRLKWHQGKLETASLPSLPRPCANACGALLGSTIYMAGGLESPTATETLKTFWSLDLSDPKAHWQELEPWPGPPRMLAVAAVQDRSFFLCSGTDLEAGAEGKVREYLRDAYRYEPRRGWKRIADLPRAAVAAPTPAPAFRESKFLIVGGDDGMLVDFKPPENHPGFPRTILEHDVVTDRWRNVGDMPVGHVTTSMVAWQNLWVMPTGEIRPGKRSPSVWSLR